MTDCGSDLARRWALALLLAGTAAPAAYAAECDGAAAGTLTLGTAAAVQPGPARTYDVALAAGQGVYVDIATLRQAAVSEEGDDDHEHEGDAKPALARNVVACNASGAVVAPQPGEVFEKGSSISDIPEGQRLRFVAPVAGRYRIAVKAGDEPRELLVRERQLGAIGNVGVTATALGRVETGPVSSKALRIFSFPGAAGQWVELKSTSENDTVLRLAAPARDGSYAQIAENDDTDGLNPVLRRRLPATGTYYLQVDSLGDETKDFTLTLKAIPAPPLPPPPTALRLGAPVSAKLSGENDARFYLLPVTAGHSYRLELTAPYDGVVAIGLPNPVEGEDGDGGPAAGFASIKQQDTGTSGTERLTFTARRSGQLLVQVKSFGIGETDGGYSLLASDLGG